MELHAVGVCHSDLTMKAVWPEAISPIVLGHEGAGVVAAVGADVTSVPTRASGSCSATAAAGRAPSAHAAGSRTAATSAR